MVTEQSGKDCLLFPKGLITSCFQSGTTNLERSLPHKVTIPRILTCRCLSMLLADSILLVPNAMFCSPVTELFLATLPSGWDTILPGVQSCIQ